MKVWCEITNDNGINVSCIKQAPAFAIDYSNCQAIIKFRCPVPLQPS